MDPKKISVFREKLEEIKNRLLGGVGKNLKSSKEETSQTVADVADEAARDYTSQLMLNLEEQDWERLKLVEEALDSIEAGTFGTCQKCSSTIPEARLQIVPFARYCVTCMDRIEKNRAIEKTSRFIDS